MWILSLFEQVTGSLLFWAQFIGETHAVFVPWQIIPYRVLKHCNNCVELIIIINCVMCINNILQAMNTESYKKNTYHVTIFAKILV